MARWISPEVLNTYNTEQLERYIRQTAKKANMNLRALEKAGVEKGSAAYRYVKALSFDGNVVAKNKKGEMYFKTSLPGASRQEKLHHASELSKFRKSKTHTPKGVERAYRKSWETFKDEKAAEIAGEREGTLTPSKAGILKAKRELETAAGKEWFNSQWGAFGKESYKIAQRMSEMVADLISEGFSARQIVRAINSIGEDGSLKEYRDYFSNKKRKNKFIKNSIMGDEDRNPFLDDSEAFGG